MRFKLDENLGLRIQQLFLERGHDCDTVHDEQLTGATDDSLFEAVGRENRILVTVDHDLSNVFRYPPERCGGIVVLNPPGETTFRMLELLSTSFLDAIETQAPTNRLWIVEPGRIRERLDDSDE